MNRAHVLSAAVLALVACGLAPASAGAGVYQVSGCNTWSPYNASPGLVTVYSACPGFVARNVGGNFSSPASAEGGWVFGAPAGTQIVGLSLAGQLRGLDGWQAALWSAGGGSPGGIYMLQNCPGATCPGAVSALGNYGIPNAAALQIRMRCGASSCSNRALSGLAQIDSATVHLEDVVRPTVRIAGGALVDGNWRSGSQVVHVDAYDNTGLQSVRAYIDGTVRAELPRPGCAWGALLPCPNGGGTLTITTGGLADGAHGLTIEVIDTVGYQAEESRRIYIDNVPPGSPLDLKSDTGDVWKAANAFDVRWQDPSPGDGSPVVSALARMCPVRDSDQRGCVVAEQARSSGKGTTTFKVPGPGDWSARIWLRDAAGNATATNSVPVEHLRFDPTPPTASIAPENTDDPTQIHVLASDDVSSVVGGEVEIQRDGENMWRPLPTSVVGDGLRATLDDSQFADGKYRIRARVVDAAGNERSTSQTTDAHAASVVLPLRIKTRLAVGRVSRVRARSSRGRKPRYRRVVNMKPRAGYGRTIRLHGRLTTPGANPVAAGPVEIWEQLSLPGAPWTPIASLATSKTGRFTYNALRGPSRLVEFRYGGTATIRPRTSTVSLLVRGSTSFDVDRHRVRNGEDVEFRGHVRGRPLPAAGKLVELQVFTRDRWRTFAQPRADAATGRWNYRYRFESVRGTQHFRFRARVRKETGYPYELGRSHRIAVRVRGI
jgi:hypothetical protein